MKNLKVFRTLALAVATVGLSGGLAFGFQTFESALNSQYGTNFDCSVCHPYTANYGADFLTAYNGNGGDPVAAFQSIEPLDSDGDGFSNLDEFNAGTNPSDGASFPEPAADTTPPVINIASPQPATYHSATLPLDYTVDEGRVELFLDSTPLSQPPAGVLTGLPLGTHNLRVAATDAAGNVASKEVNFTVNTGLLATLPDLNGNAADELAYLSVNENGGVQVLVRDSLSSEPISALRFPPRFAPLAMTAVPDIDGNGGAELAVLGLGADGTVRVTIKDTLTGDPVNGINFAPRFTPTCFTALPDLDGNGVAEIAVLGVDSTGKVRVVIKDAATRATVNAINYPVGITPVAMAPLADLDENGVPELALLWIGESGRVGVMIKDAMTRSKIKVVGFPPRFMPNSLAIVPDMDGSGVPELAVMGVNELGQTAIFVKDALSRDLVQTLGLPVQFTSMAMTVISDMGDSNAPEIAALQMDADARVRALVMDMQNGNRLNSVLFERGSVPTPPNGENIYNAQCALCHSVNGYDATGSIDLAAKGNLVAGKFSASHNGVSLSAAEQTAVAGFLDQYAAPPTTTSCTMCHGQPPSGTTSPNLQGSHLVHSELPNVGSDCSTCHGGASHNGTVDQAIAATYDSMNATATANSNLTCSNVSCHGGQTTPNWQTGTLNVNTDCRSCHSGGTSEYNSYNSGDHLRNVHVNLDCTYCHNTAALAVNHFARLDTAIMEGPASATVGGGDTFVGSYNPSTRSCTNSCHGNKTW